MPLTPDAAGLRGCGRDLEQQGRALEAARGDVHQKVLTTTWDAPAADRQRALLSQADAFARTAADEMAGAGRHLRSLADAVEGLEAAMHAAWARRQDGLRDELRSSGSDPLLAAGVPELQRELARMPPPDDAYWSTQVPVPSVSLPSVPASLPGPMGPGSTAGVVRVDREQVRALGATLLRAGTAAADARTSASGAGCLPLSRLDAYGLPGSRTGGWLADLTGSGGGAARAASGWTDGAARAGALADVIELADREGRLDEVLADPRTESAVELSARVASSAPSGDLAALLASMSEADAAFVLRNAPVEVDDYEGLDGPKLVLAASDVLAGGAGGVVAYNAGAMKATAELRRAQAAIELVRAQGVNPANVSRADWYGRLDAAKVMAASADDLARAGDDLARKGKLVPLKVGGALAVAGIAYDIHNGTDPTQAVVSGGTSFAASVAAGALIGTAIPIPVVGTLVGAAVGAVVGVFVSGAVDSLFEDGPDVGKAFESGVESITDTGKAIGDGAKKVVGAIGGLFD